MTIALTYGERLPRFASLEEAERELFLERDVLLTRLKRVSKSSAQVLDESPNSLKSLESWYFSLIDQGNDFSAVGLDRDTFEHAMSLYFGAVVVANVPSFEWFVEQYFLMAGRYEIGVRAPLIQLALTGPSNLESVPNNKRRQSLFRQFRRYARQ